MSRLLSVLLVASLFLSGVAVGALGMHLYYFERLGGPGPRMPGPPMFGRWMVERLDLSAEQERQIREILDRSHRRASEIRYELRPRVEGLMEEAADQIRQVLTPEQRQEFERLRQLQRRRTEQFLLGPGGQDGHRGRGPRFRRGAEPSPPPPPGS